MRFAKEFKDFAMKGNVVDMAVGIIIGAAFGKIIASLVKDVIMPIVGNMLGGGDVSNLAYVLEQAQGEIVAVSIKYGLFIQSIVDFLIIAMAIFMAVKVMNSMKKKEQEKPSEPPKPSKEEVLLTEIRDLLQK